MGKLCKYPDWENGGYLIGEHSWDNNGYCNICGKKKDEEKKCVYCGKFIEWGLACEDCGKREDKNLGKLFT